MDLEEVFYPALIEASLVASLHAGLTESSPLSACITECGGLYSTLLVQGSFTVRKQKWALLGKDMTPVLPSLLQKQEGKNSALQVSTCPHYP